MLLLQIFNKEGKNVSVTVFSQRKQNKFLHHVNLTVTAVSFVCTCITRESNMNAHTTCTLAVCFKAAEGMKCV